MSKLRREHLLLFAILLLGFSLRMYRLPHMVGFDFDQEYAAMFAQSVGEGTLIQYVGQGLSVPGLFMGPFYFYFLVPFFAITAFHPIGGYIASVLLGVLIAFTYYFVLSRMFGKTAGLIAAFLRSILYATIVADWSMAPSYSSELVILLTMYCLYKYWHKEYLYLLPLGFIFGLYTSFHPILFPFYFVFLAIFLIKRNIPPLKYIALSLVLFIIPLLPLILFEYFRHFLELKLLFSLEKSTSAETKSVEKLVEYVSYLFHYPVTLLTPQLSGVIKTLIALGAFLGIGYSMIKKLGFYRDSFHKTFLLVTSGVFLVYYFFLPTKVSDYYFLGATVVAFIYLIATFCLLEKKRLNLFLIGIPLVIITVLNLSLLSALWEKPKVSNLYDKEAVIKEIAKRQKDKNMNIYYDMDYGQQYGLGYLARYHQLSSKGEEDVPTYIIVLPKDKTNEKLDFTSGDIGLIVKP